jgi:hypothetical protein
MGISQKKTNKWEQAHERLLSRRIIRKMHIKTTVRRHLAQ